jgi:1-acyl-sn-glycerol-3-phosphate acyltransferase
MAKKILGDDPFSQKPQDAASGQSTEKTPSVAKKTKRAPLRKTEAPKAARAARATPAKPEREDRSEQPHAPAAVSSNGHVAVETPPVREAALVAPPSEAVAAEPAPGTWRWWRFRQQQLARAEEAAWLARVDGSQVDRFGRDPILAGRAEPIVDVLYRSLLRVSVRGLGHVPESGRAILVARRRELRSAGLAGLAFAGLQRLGLELSPTTGLDAAIIAHALRTEHVAHREVRPLVRPARLYTPLLGMLLRRLGGVPADVHDLARLLDDERLALAFVGDGAAQNGALDLKTIVCLALVTGAPIVPVVIAGASGLFGSSRRTALAFNTPLFLADEFGAEGAEDESLIERLTGELAEQLRAPTTI